MADSVLATLGDRYYLLRVKQVFSSVYHNTGWDGDYLLLSRGIPGYELGWFRKHGIEVFKCDPIIHGKIGPWPATIMSKSYPRCSTLIDAWDYSIIDHSGILPVARNHCKIKDQKTPLYNILHDLVC